MRIFRNQPLGRTRLLITAYYKLLINTHTERRSTRFFLIRPRPPLRAKSRDLLRAQTRLERFNPISSLLPEGGNPPMRIPAVINLPPGRAATLQRGRRNPEESHGLVAQAERWCTHARARERSRRVRTDRSQRSRFPSRSLVKVRAKYAERR